MQLFFSADMVIPSLDVRVGARIARPPLPNQSEFVPAVRRVAAPYISINHGRNIKFHGRPMVAPTILA